MKLRTLLFFILFALTAHSQTKEAQFRKIETLLKKSIGFTRPDFSITNIVFTEKSAKEDMTEKSIKQGVSYTGLQWDGFSYSIKESRQVPGLSAVTIYFDKEIAITTYADKETSKEDDDEMTLLVPTAEAKLLEQYLEELKGYTWKSLKELGTANREQLVSFLTKKMNAAVEWDDAKVKSLTDCEISFVYSDGVETTLPTKRLELHLKDDYYVFCYGENKAKVQVKTKSSTTSKYVEHAIVELDFDETEETKDVVEQVKYALARLSGFCRS